MGGLYLEPRHALTSFDAALSAGADVIELDVLSEHADATGRLVVVHDYRQMRVVEPLLFEDALEHLAREEFGQVGLNVDVKLPGYEARVLTALRKFGLTPRVLISSSFLETLDHIRAVDPSARLGLSVPRIRRDWSTGAITAIPVLAGMTAYRALLPLRSRALLGQGRIDAIMAHWRFVTRALVRTVSKGCGELYVFPVNDAAIIQRLTTMGVHGIITDDLRLFWRRGS
jgi:glycerophosphoryl diester phosphodiesterase